MESPGSAGRNQGRASAERPIMKLQPRSYLAFVLVAISAAGAHGQTATASSTRPHVEQLASERLAGREAGSDGERLAAEYLAAQLSRIGARPLPGSTGMFAGFEFTAGSRDGGSSLSLQRAERDGVVSGWTGGGIRALPFSDDAEVTGEVVFAGYGIIVPEAQGFGYDSYAGLDVKDKIVLVLRYFPEDADQKTKAILARYSDLRYKAMAARQRGAKAMLIVTGPRSPNAGELVPMTSDTAIAGSGIPAASISGQAAEALFAGVKPLRDVQQELDGGNPHVAGFPIPGITVTVRTSVVRERRTARNVLAFLPATVPVSDVEKPWIVAGAHYDHLGRGMGGNSLASRDEIGRPHVGADDNASGTAAVLALAEALSRQPMRRRHLLVAFWSAEEIGLIGSNAFVSTPPVPIDQIAAYLNFDMVGRMQDNRLAVQATGTSPMWASVLERANVPAGFDLAVQSDPYQPTDVATFNQAGVPSLNFTTGAHVDYHKPSDTADKINYEDLDRIVSFAAAITGRLMDLEQPPAFTKVEQSSQTPTRTGLRIFTGTIPDYATEVKGLLLGGVIGGGPAEKAGLQKGDIIVEIAGQTITNIYDYTYALELLKVDEPVKVVYMRGSERREPEMTPTVRR
jgi:Zn-dependent M28 family amino/carboxypeptidase